ncbi:glutathione peroxidase [Dokdonia pacifica]|uniref:Glutathione peroxidase n=1 Tax=Dokdonia pacifica TaxID=1627892 RepID=A0A238YMC9_9FLAO|nr:glutathione peroxidase [Dokdonia pacifica]GGG11532.1 glutathione peroxidase [Dokdonia pacifica]SNR71773.1 glutathione peroxidase [Dokdonia pacifica]
MNLINKAKTTSSIQKNTGQSLYDITINSIDGKPIDLSNFKNKKLLFVNVASECGFTKQYKDLQKLSDTYPTELVVIGSPCNQFGKQEPGNAEEIQTFCERNFGVTFLLTEKIDVKGSKQHPLFKWLTSKELNGNKNSSVKWNFQKYLVSESGKLIDYYYSITSPTSRKITKHL